MTASPGLVASAVRAELARRGRTQRQAAALLGISSQAMSKRARGLTPFRSDEVLALAKWLDAPVAVLMGEPYPSPLAMPRQSPLAQAISA